MYVVSHSNRLDFEFDIKMSEPTMIYKDDDKPVDGFQTHLKHL